MRIRKRIKQGNVVIGLGSNQGQKIKFLQDAVESLGHDVGRVALESAYYETEPWGDKDQESFINQVCIVETDLVPWQVLEKLQNIEKALHKKVIRHWGPRTIDLDIIYFDNKIIFEKQLIIPHPYMYLRNFVLIPLHEIAPRWEHPLFKRDTADLMMDCRDETKVKRIKI